VSVSEQPVRLAVHSVEDLIGLVPYLLGFHPEESLVVLMIEGGRVQLTARVDLVVAADEGNLDDLLARLFGRFPAAEGWFLAFTDDEDLAWAVLSGCTDVAGRRSVGQVLQVGRRSWRADQRDGPVGEITGEVSVAATQATVLGMPARSSRTDLAAGLVGPPDAELDVLLAEFEARAAELEHLGRSGRRRLLRRLLRTPVRCPVADCVRLALLAVRPDGQVAVLRSLARANADQQVGLWTQVLRHSLPGYRPTVLGLLGMAAWQTGDGALQVVCLEELVRLDPSVPLAAVLDALNSEVVPPWHWDVIRASLLEELALALTTAGPPASPRGR
jgi:hypothetical protein